MATQCADIIRRKAGVEIDDDRILASAEETADTFGIKEAHLYRDWQVCQRNTPLPAGKPASALDALNP